MQMTFGKFHILHISLLKVVVVLVYPFRVFVGNHKRRSYFNQKLFFFLQIILLYFIYLRKNLINYFKDICLSNNRTCEIQHSYISENEIINRFNDWNKFGKEIIWFIDGNNGIELNKLSSGNYLLIFNQSWKYKSFKKTYDYILLEIDNYVFKIELLRCKGKRCSCTYFPVLYT